MPLRPSLWYNLWRMLLLYSIPFCWIQLLFNKAYMYVVWIIVQHLNKGLNLQINCEAFLWELDGVTAPDVCVNMSSIGLCGPHENGCCIFLICRFYIDLDRQENTERDLFLEECISDPTLRDQMALVFQKYKNKAQVLYIICRTYCISMYMCRALCFVKFQKCTFYIQYITPKLEIHVMCLFVCFCYFSLLQK